MGGHSSFLLLRNSLVAVSHASHGHDDSFLDCLILLNILGILLLATFQLFVHGIAGPVIDPTDVDLHFLGHLPTIFEHFHAAVGS